MTPLCLICKQPLKNKNNWSNLLLHHDCLAAAVIEAAKNYPTERKEDGQPRPS